MYYKTRSEGFGMEVKRRIMLGNFVLSSGYYDAYYKKALQAKSLIKKAFDEAFAKYDVILGPVAPGVAPLKGQSLIDPLKMYLGDIYTVLVNIVGLPAVSIPCGFTKTDMPVGLQLIGNHFSEQTLVGAAAAFQSRTDHHRRRYPEESK
jgi:aspartyl-tRNA(Asn)/glutamyl-tRNA(Gln) amidotransferase subunit A